MSLDVFQMKMDLIIEKYPGLNSIYNDTVIYGNCEEDHDASLINLLNVVQLEGFVLNSKKLELKQPRVSLKQNTVLMACIPALRRFKVSQR